MAINRGMPINLGQQVLRASKAALRLDDVMANDAVKRDAAAD